MDTELARTFLEIVATGSFIRAAERLNVAQTTVSARIRTLEQRLGRPLFVRNKGGASLTPAGEQFLRYAPTFVQLWQRMRQQVAVPPGHRSLLTIGGEVTLWQPLVLDWALWMRRSLPDIALRVHVDVPQDLINQVAAGLVDAAVMYAPPHRPGLKIDLLLDEKLVLVATDPEVGTVDAAGLCLRGLGPGIRAGVRLELSRRPQPRTLRQPRSTRARATSLQPAGPAYCRMRTVEPYLAAGRLYLVPGMPQFSYPIYAVSSSDADESLLGPALAGLREVTAAKFGYSPHRADETSRTEKKRIQPHSPTPARPTCD